MKKKTSTGEEYSIRVFPADSLLEAQGYFLWLNSDYASTTQIQVNATSSQTLARDNSLALLDKDKNILDALAWGDSTDPFVETAPFPQNPEENQALARKWSTTTQDYLDTDDNLNDFEIQEPTPASQNQPGLQPEPEPEPEPKELLLTVVINEIAWMGTKANSADEWLEIYNNTDQPINILNWQLIFYPPGEEPRITTFATSSGTTTIDSFGYFLLERTKDDTVGDILADQLFKGALNNEGGILELRNAEGSLIDRVDASSGWFAGQKEERISMERINPTASSSDPQNWANNNLIARKGKDALNNNINATPKAENSVSKFFTEITNLPFDEFDEITLTYLGNPYIIKNPISVPPEKTLKIEPGVFLRFEDGTEIKIEGSLEAVGEENEEEKIVFMRNSTSTPSRDRYRVHFVGSPDSQIENAQFIDGGRYTYVPFYAPWGLISGVLEIENSQVFIKNSSLLQSFPFGVKATDSTTTIENVDFIGIEDSDDFKGAVALLIEGGSSIVKDSTFKENNQGIRITGGAFPIIENNIFEENKTPIFLKGPVYPLFSQNLAENNDLNGILVDSSDIIADTIWQADLPFILEGAKVIQEGAALTLKEGTALKFKSISGYLDIRGKLITQGTSTKPVIITPEGSWKTLLFHSSGSVLNGTIIRYGGGGCYIGSCWGAITQRSGAEIEIKDSTIENNKWGIFSNEADCNEALDKISLENVSFSGNERDITLIRGVTCPIP